MSIGRLSLLLRACRTRANIRRSPVRIVLLILFAAFSTSPANAQRVKLSLRRDFELELQLWVKNPRAFALSHTQWMTTYMLKCVFVSRQGPFWPVRCRLVDGQDRALPYSLDRHKPLYVDLAASLASAGTGQMGLDGNGRSYCISNLHPRVSRNERGIATLHQDMRSVAPLKTTAKEVAQTLVESLNAEETKVLLHSIQPDLMLVQCVSQIIRDDILSIPRLGTFVYHQALTPEYRGLHTILWAVANGDDGKVGYTFLKANAKIDGGEVYAQGVTTLDAIDTDELHRTLGSV